MRVNLYVNDLDRKSIQAGLMICGALRNEKYDHDNAEEIAKVIVEGAKAVYPSAHLTQQSKFATSFKVWANANDVIAWIGL